MHWASPRRRPARAFGFLMDAYKFAHPARRYGHGLDRMVMLMLKKRFHPRRHRLPEGAERNKREPMSGAPDVVDAQQLSDLSIALTLKD